MGFSWSDYANKIYGLNSAKKIKSLSEKMIEEFPKGGSVFLDNYTSREIKEARKIYDKFIEKQ